MSTTEMWDVYYEEEKRKMEECLARLMSSTTDDVKIRNSQSVHGSMTAQQMGKRKQFIIDALLKIRGRGWSMSYFHFVLQYCCQATVILQFN
jgi:hypothetical protein